MKSANKFKKAPSPFIKDNVAAKTTKPQETCEVKIEKIIKKYRLGNVEKQEDDDLKCWASVSTSEKTETSYSLWEECYWIQKGVNINAQRLRRVLKIVKLPQS